MHGSIRICPQPSIPTHQNGLYELSSDHARHAADALEDEADQQRHEAVDDGPHQVRQDDHRERRGCTITDKQQPQRRRRQRHHRAQADHAEHLLHFHAAQQPHQRQHRQAQADQRQRGQQAREELSRRRSATR